MEKKNFGPNVRYWVVGVHFASINIIRAQEASPRAKGSRSRRWCSGCAGPEMYDARARDVSDAGPVADPKTISIFFVYKPRAFTSGRRFLSKDKLSRYR